MATESAGFTAYESSKLSDFNKIKSEWSQKYLNDSLTSFSASNTKNKIVTPEPSQNVVGVGVGEKVTNGTVEGILAVKFFVRVKYPKDQLSKADLLPETIDGLPVDVEETGTFRALAMPDPRQKIRPAQPGCSIGFADPAGQFVMAGTFGALVKDSKNDFYILSNNHVIADENQLPVGSDIFQPGLLDGGNAAKDQVAKLTKAVQMLPLGFNKVDAAIAKIDNKNDVSNSILFIGPPKGNKKAARDMQVHKFGRTTSYTVGRIASINTDVKVAYDTGEFNFSQQIIIIGDNNTSFSDSGDSGSLILERSSQKAVGLLFAGSKTHTIANHISDVLSELKVKLV